MEGSKTCRSCKNQAELVVNFPANRDGFTFNKSVDVDVGSCDQSKVGGQELHEVHNLGSDAFNALKCSMSGCIDADQSGSSEGIMTSSANSFLCQRLCLVGGFITFQAPHMTEQGPVSLLRDDGSTPDHSALLGSPDYGEYAYEARVSCYYAEVMVS